MSETPPEYGSSGSRQGEPPTEADLNRIEQCLPPLHDDGEAGFAITLGTYGDAEATFDTDDVRALVAEVRRLRQELAAARAEIGRRDFEALPKG